MILKNARARAKANLLARVGHPVREGNVLNFWKVMS